MYDSRCCTNIIDCPAPKLPTIYPKQMMTRKNNGMETVQNDSLASHSCL